MKEYIKLTVSQRFWHYGPLWVYLVLTLYIIGRTLIQQLLDLEPDKLEIRYVLCLALYVLSAFILYYIRKISLRYSVYKIKCTDDDYFTAVERCVSEDNWTELERHGFEIKAIKKGVFSRHGELISIKKINDYVLINSICFPSPTTNPFDPISNRKNVKTFMDILNQETSSKV
ncbi:MAG: hypothetical protein ACPH25_04390 [Schleiferiaceae bacterium]|jgi:hypothetical protein